MSLQAVRLSNFRGFRDSELKLKRLTVLLGPNSSGKSSFGHALAAISHAHRIYRGTPQATLTPSQEEARDWPVDLGGLRDLRTTGAEGPVTLELTTTSGLIKIGFGIEAVPSLVPSYFVIPEGESSSGDAASLPITQSRAEGGHIVGVSTSVDAVERNHSFVSKPYIELTRINEGEWVESGVSSVVILEGLLPKGFAHHGGTSRLVSGTALDELESILTHTTYLRASRRRPFRTYPNEIGKYQDIGYGGEHTAAILQKRVKVVYAAVPPFSTRKTPKTIDSVPIKEGLLSSAVQTWLRHLGLAHSVESVRIEKSDRSRLRLMVTPPGQDAHNITEVGFGVSQVLPIITAGLLQQKDSLFIVDLPEAHLHPKPQAELADFFCSLALSGRYSLVETHSEMFFHRLRLRAEMIPELRENIAVYFLNAADKNGCCEPRPVGLTLSKEPEWPVGFFQEGWEMEVQLGMLRRTHRDIE